MTGHGIWGYIPSICGHMTVYVMLSGFQIIDSRANHLAQGSNLGNNGVETKVAGLFTVRDASYYRENNMPCHGSYSKSSLTL